MIYQDANLTLMVNCYEGNYPRNPAMATFGSLYYVAKAGTVIESTETVGSNSLKKSAVSDGGRDGVSWNYSFTRSNLKLDVIDADWAWAYAISLTQNGGCGWIGCLLSN